MKNIISNLLSLFIFNFAYCGTLDTTPTTSFNEIPKCSEGMKYLTDNVFLNDTYSMCYAEPSSLEIKVYKISFISSDNSSIPIYVNDNAEYVNMIGNKFIPVRDYSNLSEGEYSKIEIQIGAKYKVLIDQEIMKIDGSSSRLISSSCNHTSCQNWEINNTNITSGGHPNLKYIFRRSEDDFAEKIEFKHNSYIFTGDTLSGINNKYYSGHNSCSFISGTSNYGGSYYEAVEWNNVSSSVSKITQSQTLDRSGQEIEQCIYDAGGNQWYHPEDDLERSKITIHLSSNFEYKKDKGYIFNWNWDVKKFFILGIHPSDTNSEIGIIAIGPYSFDLGISEVERSNFEGDEIIPE